MRKLILKLLFRLLEGNTMPKVSDSDKSILQSEFALLYKSGVFLKYLSSREDRIYKIWKSAVGQKDDIARGRSIEIESLKNKLKSSFEEEEKRKKEEQARQKEEKK